MNNRQMPMMGMPNKIPNFPMPGNTQPTMQGNMQGRGMPNMPGMPQSTNSMAYMLNPQMMQNYNQMPR